MPELTDEQIREVLAKVGKSPLFPKEYWMYVWDQFHEQHPDTHFIPLLRLLAECWQALGEIIETGERDTMSFPDQIEAMIAIARRVKEKK